jgi:hypothetical protein
MKSEDLLVVLVLVFVFEFAFWLSGIIGSLVVLIIGLILVVLPDFIEKHYKKQQENWKCPICQRINSPKTKICTKCGFEGGYEAES